MPQPERSRNMRKILVWLRDVQAQATISQIISYTMFEASNLGCTDRTARNYIETLRRAGFIREKDLRIRVTPAGKNWLARHGF